MSKSQATLFKLGDFVLHSGSQSNFKIECDSLTSADWDTIATWVTSRYKFRTVFGVPRGGVLFARALMKYRDRQAEAVLIVDDVLTTGRTMREARTRRYRREVSVYGVVLFAREEPPSWIEPIFQMW